MILLVDDKPLFIAPLKEAFDAAGFIINLAMTADECIQIVRSRDPIDAIVLDVMLPPGSMDLPEVDYGMNTGLVLLNMIRESRPFIPIILHSVRDDLSAVETHDRLTIVASKSGATPAELVKLVESVVRSQPE